MTETLYRTKTLQPTTWRQEFFELSLGEQTVDGQPGFYVRETHCWWDGSASPALRVQYTLSPREGFATFEEAHARYQSQRLERARRGFVHSFIPCYDSTKKNKYVLIGIPPQATEESKPTEQKPDTSL